MLFIDHVIYRPGAIYSVLFKDHVLFIDRLLFMEHVLWVVPALESLFFPLLRAGKSISWMRDLVDARLRA